jgi:hypothetical protein
MTDVPGIFKNPKKKVFFVGGPNDKDFIRIMDDVKGVYIRDKEDPSILYNYLRTEEDTLSYTGVVTPPVLDPEEVGELPLDTDTENK